MNSNIDVTRTLIVIAICTACTVFERAFPFLVFGKRPVPDIVRRLGRVLPMALMTTLIIYCIKDISFAAAGQWVPYIAGIAATALLHLWKSNSLLSIAGGTAVYMVLIRMIV